MTDRPIIFSAPMVRALLDGRKSMTRRMAWRYVGKAHPRDEDLIRKPSPWQKVRPGDRLWVREQWGHDGPDLDTVRRGVESGGTFYGPYYTADADWFDNATVKRKPPIHLPRWASRLTLTVAAVKIERLLDISEEDARAEGFEAGQLDDGFGPRNIGGGFTVESPGTFASAAGMFQVTWAKLHPDWDGYSSLEVVALTFTVARRNIDAKEP